MNHYIHLYPICILSSLLLFSQSYAQSFEPVFEDADGKSSIIAPRGFFGINTANSTIRFQYFYARSASPDPNDRTKVGRWNRLYGGINVAGSAEGGITNLFSDGTFNPGTSAELLLGHRSLLFGTVDRHDRTGETVKYYLGNKKVTIQDWLTLRTGLKAARYKLYDVSLPFNQQVFYEHFRGHIIQLAYTLLFDGATSVGVSWDVSRVNNIDDLAPTKFIQQRTLTDPVSQTTRIFEQEVNAYAGTFQTSIINTYSIDLVRLMATNTSDTRFAFHLFGRRLRTNEASVYKSGVGFYVFPKGKLFGGVFVESNDLTNTVSYTPDFLKRLDIGLTVKFLLPSLGSPGN